MADAKEIRDIAEAAKGIVEAVPVYQDALQPAAKEVGKSLALVGRAVNVALSPIAVIVWGYDRIADYLSARLAEKLATTPPEDIVTPPPNIAGPAIEAMRFTAEDPNLREMFASLLATSMDKRTVSDAHPAFVEIIKQLTSDEAKMLRVLTDFVWRPVITVLFTGPDFAGQKLATRNQSMLDEEANVSDPRLVPGYIDNLCRLGVTEIPPITSLKNAKRYEELETHPAIQTLLEEIRGRGYEPKIDRHLIRLTSLGELFVRACIMDHASIRQGGEGEVPVERPAGRDA